MVTRAESHDAAETIRAYLWGHIRSDINLVDQSILVDRGQKELGNERPAREARSSSSPGDAHGPDTPGGDRSFETPIGNQEQVADQYFVRPELSEQCRDILAP